MGFERSYGSVWSGMRQLVVEMNMYTVNCSDGMMLTSMGRNMQLRFLCQRLQHLQKLRGSRISLQHTFRRNLGVSIVSWVVVLQLPIVKYPQQIVIRQFLCSRPTL